jgi:hypothetical protein
LTVTVTGNSASKTYNGSEQKVEGFTTDAPANVTVALADGKAAIAKGTNAGTYHMNLANDYFTVSNTDSTIKTVVLNVVDGTLTITKASLALTNTGATASKVYTGSEQEITDFTTTGLVGGAVLSGISYSAKGTNVGTYDGVFSGTAVIMADGADVTENYVITNTPGKLTITKASLALTNTGATASKVYTGSEQEITDFTTSGLVGGAVLSGITYSAKGTNVGTYDGVFSGTPVIKVGDVDVTQNYAVTNKPGTLTITKAALALTNTGASDSKVYTGSEQEITDFTTTGLVGGAVLSGITYSAKGTNVGTYGGSFSGTPVITANGVDVTENYKITNIPGKLTITKASLALTNEASPATRTYTGHEQEVTDFTTTGLVGGAVLSGITYSAKGTNVGTYDGAFSGTPVIKVGDVDVTENYVITNKPSTLTITKADFNLTNTGASASKVYTGSEQEITDFTTEGLLDGHKLSGVSYSAKGKNVGTYTGTFSGTAKITDAGGNDVTENYAITNTPGTLTITKASLALTNTGASDSKVYTGSEQEITDFTTTGLVGGAVLSGISYSAKGTNVGTYDGVFSGTAVIMADGADVTENYVITNTPGKLTITKASLALTNTGATASKVYTGSEQEITNFTTSGLIGGAVLSGITYSAKGTNVGTYDGVFSGTPVIKVGDVDVTQNYAVTNKPGTLTITKAALALTNTGASDSKVYTGSEQEITDFTTTGLVGGAVLSGITYSAKGTNVGTYGGSFSGTPVIKVGDVDVTQNYVVTNTPGTLTITKASLALTNEASPATRTYTGHEQEVTDFTTTGLVGGAVLSGITYSAKGTNVGTYDGKFSGTPVIKVGDVDVTENYVITNKPSTLTITKADFNLTNTGASASKVYTGSEQEITDFTTEGLLDGHKLSGVSYSAKGKNVGTYTGTFSGTAKITDAGENDVTENYAITNTPGTLTITKASLALTNTGASDSKVYTGSEQEITDFTTTGLVGGAVLSGISYSAKGTNVGTYDGVFSGTAVIKVGDVDVTENYVITNTPGKLTITKASLALTNTGATASKVYTGSEQEITDFTTSGLVGGAVLSGITYSAKGTNVGTYDGVFSGTPVIKVGDVDVTQNYAVTNKPGTLTITKAALALTNTGASDSKVYTGSEQEITDFTTTGLVGGAVLSGITYSAKGTNVGTYGGSFSGTPVITANGVDVTENYKITNIPGKLTITKASLALTNEASPATRTYTGHEQEVTDFTTTGLVGGAVLSGITYSAKGTNVGTYDGAFSGTPVIKVGDVDVTENYVITNKPSTLTITKADFNLTNTGASASKVYTGSEQEITDFTTEGLLDGHKLSGVSYSAKGKNVGTYTGTFSGTAKITDAGGNDVTENYAITNTPGTLTITKASLALTNTGASDSKVYTGSEQEITDFTTTGLVGGAVLSGISYSAKGTNVGTYDGVFSGTAVIMADGADVTENYVITNTPGKLTITPASLALTNTGASDSKVYTGSEQEITNFTTAGLIGGAVLSGITYSAKGTNVGTYDGVFSGTPVIKVGDVDVTQNYVVTNKPGKLTITKAALALTNTGASDSKVYTGSEQEITDFTTTGLVGGAVLSGITYSAKGTNVGTYDGVFSGTPVIKVGDVDVTQNYVVTNTPGTLTITKASLALTNEASPATKMYTGHEQEVTDFTTTGLVGGAVLSGITYSAKGTNVGTYDGKFSGTPVIKVGDVDVTENYVITNKPSTLTITKADFNLTNTGASASKVYTGSEQEITDFTTEGLLDGHKLSGVSYSAKGKNVGTYTGTFSGTAKITDAGGNDVTENYAITNTPGTLTITKASLALTNTGASDSKVYTGSEQEITDFTTTGLVDGAVLSGISYSAKGTNVGTYDGVFSGTAVIMADGADVTENYVITNTPGKLTITKAPAEKNTVTAVDYVGAYDASAHTITASAEQDGSTLYYSKVRGTEASDWSTTAPTWTDVTAARTVYVKATNPNYEDSYANATVTITLRPVTVTADDKSKVEGTKDPAFTASVNGTIGNDAVTYTLSRAAGETAGTYAITPSGDAIQGNYSVTYVAGTLTIVPDTSGSYIVYYLEEGTNTPLADSKTVTGQIIGSTVTEHAKNFADYSLVSDQDISITIEKTGNVITFYYRKDGTPTPTPTPEPTPTPGPTPEPTPLPRPTPVPTPNTETTIPPVTDGQVLGAKRTTGSGSDNTEKSGKVLGERRTNVQTGDESMMMTWLAMFGAAISGLILWVQEQRKRRKK